MPFVPVPEVAKFTVHQLYFGQQVINGFHVKREGGWTPETLLAMCDIFIAFWNAEIADYNANTMVYVKVTARDLTTEAGLIAEKPFPALSTGVGAGEGMPGNVALAVAHKTAQAGRSYRGRTFLSGFTEAMCLGNSVNESIRTGLITIFNLLDANILAGGGTWGVVSLYEGYTQVGPKYKKVPTPRPVGIFTDITSHACDGFIDSQRRRLAGRGS